MEIPFERPATPIVPDGLAQGQSVRRGIGDLDAPPQAMPPGGNGFLVPLYAGEGITDLNLGSHRTLRATPPTTYVAGHGRLVPLPRGRQQPSDIEPFQHTSHRRLQGVCVPDLTLAPPWGGASAFAAPLPLLPTGSPGWLVGAGPGLAKIRP